MQAAGDNDADDDNDERLHRNIVLEMSCTKSEYLHDQAPLSCWMNTGIRTDACQNLCVVVENSRRAQKLIKSHCGVSIRPSRLGSTIVLVLLEMAILE